MKAQMAEQIWLSPDGNIKKQIIRNGICGLKPIENSECIIRITNTSSAGQDYASLTSFIIGNSHTRFERLLEHCLFSMYPTEVAIFTLTLNHDIKHSFTLELQKCNLNGLIYEWNAKEKFELALKNKQKGIKLYKESRHIDASHQFAKSLKILCSIPLQIDKPTTEINGMSVSDIDNLKTVLYNNLASCYLKHCDYESVLKLISKVLERDCENVKALYKQAIARCETHDYDGSQESLLHILELEKDNKVAIEKLKFVNIKVAESNAKVNTIIKKMFV